MMTMEMIVNVKFVLLFAILKATTLFVKGEDGKHISFFLKTPKWLSDVCVFMQFSTQFRVVYKPSTLTLPQMQKLKQQENKIKERKKRIREGSHCFKK